MNKELKTGDRVSFDFEGALKSPSGFGIVTNVNKGNVMVQPDGNVPTNLKMINIQKVGN